MFWHTTNVISCRNSMFLLTVRTTHPGEIETGLGEIDMGPRYIETGPREIEAGLREIDTDLREGRKETVSCVKGCKRRVDIFSCFFATTCFDQLVCLLCI